MNLDMQVKLKKLLIQHESLKLMPYRDTKNKISIGIGRNLTDRGVLPAEVDFMYTNDAHYFFEKLSDNFRWFNYLDDNRQIALIDMAFQGWTHFLEFKKMIKAFEKKDFMTAANEILNSEYAFQVGQRAIDIANIIKTGVIE